MVAINRQHDLCIRVVVWRSPYLPDGDTKLSDDRMFFDAEGVARVLRYSDPHGAVATHSLEGGEMCCYDGEETFGVIEFADLQKFIESSEYEGKEQVAHWLLKTADLLYCRFGLHLTSKTFDEFYEWMWEHEDINDGTIMFASYEKWDYAWTIGAVSRGELGNITDGRVFAGEEFGDFVSPPIVIPPFEEATES